MPITGGNTQLAAGGMNAAETVFQEERGIKDAIATMYEDTVKGGKHLAKPELVEILAKNSASSIDWLTSIGADMSDIGRMGGASVSRTHRPTSGSGPIATWLVVPVWPNGIRSSPQNARCSHVPSLNWSMIDLGGLAGSRYT